MRNNLKPGRFLEAYADDIALILHNCWEELGELFRIMDEIFAATNLRINLEKSVIIPLFAAKLEKVKERIGQIWPHLAALEVAECAKYLGFWVGPIGSNESSWKKPAIKFSERCTTANSLGNGKTTAIAGANMYGYFILSYVAMLREPTEQLIKLSEHLNRVLLGGPYRWLPDVLTGIAKSHLNMGIAPQVLVDYCFAVKLRLICRNCIDWEACCNKLDLLRSSLNRISARRDERPCFSISVGNLWEKQISVRVPERAAAQGMQNLKKYKERT